MTAGRRSTPWARLLGISALALLAGCSTPAASSPERGASESPGGAVGAVDAAPTDAATGCVPSGSAETPAGPRSKAVVATATGSDAPAVQMLRYQRPETAGEPWSHWGQGLVLDDGRFVSAMGNHLGEDGNSFLFVYDPSTGENTRFADLREEIGGDPSWGFGKVHGQIVAGRCGDAYLSTYWGTRKGLTYSPTYRGDVMLRVDTESWDVEPLGVLAEEHGVPSLAAAPGEGLVYAEAVDPLAEPTDRQGDQGAFVVVDPETQEELFRSDTTDHIGFRNVMVDGMGRAYLAAQDGRLLRFDPGGSELVPHPDRLPGGGSLRASSAPTTDGTVFGVTSKPEEFFALAPDGSIRPIGEAQGYTTSIAAEPDGSQFYYVPGAHGRAPELGTPLVAVDTRTGEQTTLARLDDLAASSLDVRTSGSYSVVLDAESRRLFVMLNAGESEDDRWGEVVLAIVDLPPAVGESAVAETGTGSFCSASYDSGFSYEASTEGRSGPLQFADATDAWGGEEALTGMRGHAVAAGDVNGDGWTDLFVGTFADREKQDYQHRGADGPAPDRLLLGGPDGFSVDETFPGDRGRTSGAAFGDLDSDGDLDLVVARNARGTELGSAPSVVLRNDDGAFTLAATLSEPEGARSVGLLDYDADGRTDLFIAEDRFSGGSSVLLRNTGTFTFEDVTDSSGVGRGVAGMGVGTGDLDNDGDPDLVVGGSNRVFVNQGSGRFDEQERAIPPWRVFGDEDDAAGVAQGDVNGDGRLDVVIGQHYNSTIDDGSLVPVRLYLNEPTDDGGLRLRDVTDDAGLVGLPTKSPHVEIADVDSDGRPDVVTTAAGVDGQPIVFRNLGTSGGLPEFEASTKPGPTQYWVTGAVFDADHDGRLDVVAVEWEPSLPTLFLRNTADTGRWLGVTAPSGSSVEVFEAGGLAAPERRLAGAAVGISTGYGAGPSHQAWVGLGSAESVDVSISHPDLGSVELRGTRVDRMLVCGS